MLHDVSGEKTKPNMKKENVMESTLSVGSSNATAVFQMDAPEPQSLSIK